MKLNLMNADCLDVLKTIESDSVDSIVTDPPYGLSRAPDMTEVLTRWLNGDDYYHRGSGFMGKSWDSFVPGPSIWRECFRVLKPGGHLLCFFGSRTYDLGTTAIRIAGFEIRDQIMWVYGSGFPKSHNLGKAIDKAEGVEPTVIGHSDNGIAGGTGEFTAGNANTAGYKADFDITVPTSENAKKWGGWGTALKPAHEPICMARKPFKGTVTENVLQHGTGALNINVCRVGEQVRYNPPSASKPGGVALMMSVHGMPEDGQGSIVQGRWPANFTHDGSDEVLALFPHSKSNGNRSDASRKAPVSATLWLMDNHMSQEYNDSGSVARFFYCPKATKTDRNEGVLGEHMTAAEMTNRKENSAGLNSPRAGAGRKSGALNYHPTVKPTNLMAWLCKLVTPPGGLILDPFMGSGSTGKAAVMNGYDFTGIEADEGYFEIAEQRIKFKVPK